MSKSKLTKEQKQIVKNLTPEEIERIMTPKNDIIFKKLFGAVGREAMVKDFLEAILEVSIKSVMLGRETILLPEEVNEKTGVLDVRVTLDNGTEIDVEIQNGKGEHIIKRSHFYLSRLYGKQLKASEKYEELKKAIVIFITSFELFSDIEDYHTKWLMTEQENKEKHFDEMELHFIELPKFLRTKFDKQRKIDQWLLFIDYSRKEIIKEIMEENENVKEAVENMEKIKSDEHEQYLAWLRQKYRLDMNSMHSAGVKEGIKEGIKKTVKRMLKENIDMEMIIKISQLSEEEIEKIKLEMREK